VTDALGVDLGVEEGDVDAHEAEEDAVVGEEVGSFLEGCKVERFTKEAMLQCRVAKTEV